ncbi:MAG: hypothetical protein WAK17_06900 [Candidatus Nitrosopolaris sp.]
MGVVGATEKLERIMEDIQKVKEISSTEKIKAVPRLLKQSSGNNSKIVCFRNIPTAMMMIQRKKMNALQGTEQV